MSARDRAIKRANAERRDALQRLVTGWSAGHWTPGCGYTPDSPHRLGTGGTTLSFVSGSPSAPDRRDLADAYREERARK